MDTCNNDLYQMNTGEIYIKAIVQYLEINSSAVDKYIEALIEKGCLQGIGGTLGHREVKV